MTRGPALGDRIWEPLLAAARQATEQKGRDKKGWDRPEPVSACQVGVQVPPYSIRNRIARRRRLWRAKLCKFLDVIRGVQVLDTVVTPTVIPDFSFDSDALEGALHKSRVKR